MIFLPQSLHDRSVIPAGTSSPGGGPIAFLVPCNLGFPSPFSIFPHTTRRWRSSIDSIDISSFLICPKSMYILSLWQARAWYCVSLSFSLSLQYLMCCADGVPWDWVWLKLTSTKLTCNNANTTLWLCSRISSQEWDRSAWPNRKSFMPAPGFKSNKTMSKGGLPSPVHPGFRICDASRRTGRDDYYYYHMYMIMVSFLLQKLHKALLDDQVFIVLFDGWGVDPIMCFRYLWWLCFSW